MVLLTETLVVVSHLLEVCLTPDEEADLNSKTSEALTNVWKMFEYIEKICSSAHYDKNTTQLRNKLLLI